ncbi:MAG TPA: hypothetical protein VFD33_06570, partial [Bacillota bacterium]|nr:hypothetical protein [Bacillota bacterium]
LMVHLLTAYKYNKKSSTAFFVGNIAPDSISTWKEKDKSHLRGRPDRLQALIKLAEGYQDQSDLDKGILLHLYLDYKWDIGPLKGFIEGYKGQGWLQAYRHEIGLASAWVYHHTSWSQRVWDQMESYPESLYKNTYGFDKGEIASLISSNRSWHRENNIGPSTLYPPDFTEEFTSRIAIEFKDWLDSL